MRTLILLGTAISLGAMMAACGSGGGSAPARAPATEARARAAARRRPRGSDDGRGRRARLRRRPDGDSSASDSDACGSVMLETHTKPGNIVVVFDQSNSMKQPFQAGSGAQVACRRGRARRRAHADPGDPQRRGDLLPDPGDRQHLQPRRSHRHPPQIPIEAGPRS